MNLQSAEPLPWVDCLVEVRYYRRVKLRQDVWRKYRAAGDCDADLQDLEATRQDMRRLVATPNDFDVDVKDIKKQD